MKKFLATTAIALVGMSTAASAQSVLERVLGQIDNSTNLASVNGTFANIAENIGGSSNIYVDATGNVLTQSEYVDLQNAPLQTDYQTVTATAAAQYWVNPTTGEVLTNTAYSALSATDQSAYRDVFASGAQAYYVSASGDVITAAEYNTYYATEAARTTAVDAYTAEVIDTGTSGIDGSITNIIAGLDAATQVAIASANTSATEWNTPTVDLGDMSTTALGAVNTGDITLGVNSAVDDAKTTSTEAVSSVMTQLGGSADTGAIVLNVASNMTGVNGSISNTMSAVNGSVGALSTTALGAVNTGTITSGVNAAVQGIVGTSGQ